VQKSLATEMTYLHSVFRYCGIFDQEMGASQGSMVPVTSFDPKINYLVKAISPGK